MCMYIYRAALTHTHIHSLTHRHIGSTLVHKQTARCARLVAFVYPTVLLCGYVRVSVCMYCWLPGLAWAASPHSLCRSLTLSLSRSLSLFVSPTTLATTRFSEKVKTHKKAIANIKSTRQQSIYTYICTNAHAHAHRYACICVCVCACYWFSFLL